MPRSQLNFRIDGEVEQLRQELEKLKQQLEAQETRQIARHKTPSWDEVVAADKAVAEILGLGSQSDLENFDPKGQEKPDKVQLQQQPDRRQLDIEKWLQLRERFSGMTRRSLLAELTKRDIPHRDLDGHQRIKEEMIDVLVEFEMEGFYYP